jgi:DtxR family transcriptional regulator, Mn-dependent transcriptional regulator
VALAEEEGHQAPLPLADLAQALAVSVVSAHQMARRLEGRGLLRYRPYRGVTLLPEGRRAARRVLRGRRLWAAFLAGHLGFSNEEADALACAFEHVTPPAAADRLAGYLGEPRVGPRGEAIPPSARTGAPAGRARR